MAWKTVKEASEILGCSERTIRRKAVDGKLQSRLVDGHGGNGQVWEIFLDDPEISSPEISLSKGEQKRVSSPKISITDNHGQKNKVTDNHGQSRTEKSNNNQITKYNKINDLTLGDRQIEEKKEESTDKKSEFEGAFISLPEKELTISRTKSTDKTTQKVGGVTFGVTSDVRENKTLTYNELAESFLWIPIADAVTLTNQTKMTIYRKIEKGKLLSLVVKSPDGGERTFLNIEGFSEKVKMEWKKLQVEKMGSNLPQAILNEHKEFELHCQEDKEKAFARLEIIKSFYDHRNFAKQNKQSLGKMAESFEFAINEEGLCEKQLKILGYTKLSIKTIYKWMKKYESSPDAKYPLSLVENRKQKSGRKKIVTSEIKAEIVNLAYNNNSLKASEIYRILKSGTLDGTVFFSARTCAEIVAEARKNKSMINKIKGKTAYKNKVRPHVSRINNLMPNQTWESDGHRMNNFVKSPFFFHSNPNMRGLVRPTAIVWYDVATGMITGFAMTLSESANSIRTSLRDAVEKCGIPESIRIDNGSGYKNYSHTPYYFAGLSKNSDAKKKASEMLKRGDYGLYQNLGIEKVSFATPGNPESKSIEPFWGFALSLFEKAFPVWIGNKIENRPEILKLSSKAIQKKYGEHIPNWFQYLRLFEQYVNLWNNQKRNVLRNLAGDEMSPAECFAELGEITVPSSAFLDRVVRDCFPIKATVQREGILANGLYYWHDLFMQYNGREVHYYYDERDFSSIKISSVYGEMWEQPAVVRIPGLQIGDDMEALKQARRDEKAGLKLLEQIYLTGAETLQQQQNLMNLPAEELLIDQDRIHEKHKADKLDIFKQKRIEQPAIKIQKETEIDYSSFTLERKETTENEANSEQETIDYSDVTLEKKNTEIVVDDELLKAYLEERKKYY